MTAPVSSVQDTIKHLQAAKDYLAAYGWTTGGIGRSGGRACALGALARVYGYSTRSGLTTEAIRWLEVNDGEAVVALAQAVPACSVLPSSHYLWESWAQYVVSHGREPDISIAAQLVYTFNDMQDSVEPINDLFDRAIVSLEESSESQESLEGEPPE